MYSNISISQHGMLANSLRMRVIAENIANENTTSLIPGGEPYRRKVALFKNVYDSSKNATVLQVNKISYDKSPFTKVYEPDHPSAGKDGYVLKPNVELAIETADMREAMYSYNANMAAFTISRSMFNKSLEILG